MSQQHQRIREVYTEIYESDTQWYSVSLERDLGVTSVKAYALNVYYEDDDTPDSKRLVGGTSLYEAGNGLPTLIETRKAAVHAMNIVVAELLALIHLDREPRHPLLTMMNTSAKIEEVRQELEDIFHTVIE